MGGKALAADSTSFLGNLRVLDVSSYIAGPAAAAILADFGADVIKIEPPGGGDPYRRVHLSAGNPRCDVAYSWQMDNRSKRSLALDLAAPAGREIFFKLLADADVLIINTPLKSRKKLGLTYEDLKPLNPRLVYASFTAYGEEGPEADRSGFDHTALWARTGLMDTIRPAPDAPPSRVALGMGDHISALTIFASIMAALYRREVTGEGSSVKSNLMANGLWCNAIQVQAMLAGAEYGYRPARENADNALHNLYQTADGRWFHLVLLPEEKRWPDFVKVIEREDLLDDPRFATMAARHANASTLIGILDAIFASRDMAYWQERLDAVSIPFGAVYRLRDIPDDVQANVSDALTPLYGLEGKADRTVNSPLWIDGVNKRPAGRAPELGEHSRDILREAGLSAEEIDALRAANVVEIYEAEG